MQERKFKLELIILYMMIISPIILHSSQKICISSLVENYSSNYGNCASYNSTWNKISTRLSSSPRTSEGLAQVKRDRTEGIPYTSR